MKHAKSEIMCKLDNVQINNMTLKKMCTKCIQRVKHVPPITFIAKHATQILNNKPHELVHAQIELRLTLI